MSPLHLVANRYHVQLLMGDRSLLEMMNLSERVDCDILKNIRYKYAKIIWTYKWDTTYHATHLRLSG